MGGHEKSYSRNCDVSLETIFYQFSKHSLIIIVRINKSISDASSTTDGKASRPSTGASAKNLFVP